MENLKILLLNASSVYGGGEYYTLKLAIELKQRGYKIIAACKQEDKLFDKLNESGIRTIGISFPEKGSSGLWKNVKQIKKIINSERIGIVHSNTSYDRTCAGFSILGTAAKHVTSCHSLESISHNLTHFIRNKYLTHHFIADGESIKDLIMKDNNIPIGKITVIHNGINAAEISRDERLRDLVRREFYVSPNEILIGTVGRLVPFKGYKYLISAFKNVTQKLNNVKLVIVGDGELMSGLREECDVLQISNKVIFPGFRDDLQAVYSAFDLYVNSSVSGGGELFPFSILYAMAQSLCVVATRVGDIPAMVKDGVTGFLADEKSPYSLSDKLVMVIENSELRNKLGGEALKYVTENFSIGRMVSETEEVYKKVI